MWKVLILVVSIAIPTTSRADDSVAKAEAEFSACVTMGILAETIMRQRQDGGVMSKLLEIVSTESSKRLVFEAYRVPMAETPEDRERYIAEHRNAAEFSCFEELEAASK